MSLDEIQRVAVVNADVNGIVGLAGRVERSNNAGWGNRQPGTP
jgi:hypothetical protein